MNWEKQSSIKQILTQRRIEKNIELFGTIFISFILGIATGLTISAYFISLTLR